ncbi:pentapeptide repeat-containing protein [Sphaerimonospora cavernae]|uniref:Pentapeptide repeat-containing protein n=1 Tax=Sphaerimonospora cavernae TaxID=1740611 RepID=A0ABV6U581_9ACTN
MAGVIVLMAGLAVIFFSAYRDEYFALLARIPRGEILVLAGLILFFTGLGLLISRRVSSSSEKLLTPMRVLSPWWILGGFVAVIVSTYTATAVLTNVAGTDPALRLDAIKSGLTVGAGAAGGVALLLAVRRQWLGERTQTYQEYDATEKRITDLYSKAVDQLGSDKAGVRIAAMYALERLGRNNPEHRQSILDVICAYLRTPATDQRGGSSKQVEASKDGDGIECQERDDDGDHLDLEVRLTAQHILSRHLRSKLLYSWRSSNEIGGEDYWPGMKLDLTRAYLVNFDLSDCQVDSASFERAAFIGQTRFSGSSFQGRANFERAVFEGVADFGASKFSGAHFMGATFASAAIFQYADFRRESNFREAKFDSVDFQGSRFRTVRFDKACFNGEISNFRNTDFFAGYFGGVAFRSKLDLSEATFRGGVLFDGVHFSDSARFDDTFFGRASFRNSSFRGDASFVGVASRGIAYQMDPEAGGVHVDRSMRTADEGISAIQQLIRWLLVRRTASPPDIQYLEFNDVNFLGNVDFTDAGISGDGLSGATFPLGTSNIRVWPSGWRETTKGDGFGTIFSSSQTEEGEGDECCEEEH